MSDIKVIFQLLTNVCYYLFSEGIEYLKRSISIWVNLKPKDMLLINLSDAEIQRLNYEKFYYPCPIVQKRIHAVYMKATVDFSDTMIGQLTGLHRHSVRHWTQIYQKEGFESLCRFQYGTNKSGLESHSESILKSFTERPPMNAREAKSRIEDMTGISRSPSQVRTFMKRHGLHYIKTGHIPAKADTEKQKQWIKSTLEPAIEDAKNGKSHLLFMDAAHFILEPFICALWCKVRMYIKAASGRNRINVLGTVNAITKEVFTVSNTSYISAETIVAFFKQLIVYYGDLPLKIVLDNARYQHCKFVEEVAKKLNITLLFLPSYSPNLNIIERLWKFTKKEILYAKYYETPMKFHKAIGEFFQTVNQKYRTDLKKLLTLNFQFFKNENVLIYPV
ncbi:MAG: IS630 family transposase [Bacteroidia bacterium]|nr:IS630 family transposase [Bacteroidia bacterium]